MESARCAINGRGRFSWAIDAHGKITAMRGCPDIALIDAQDYMEEHGLPNRHGIKVPHFACEAMAGTLVSMTAALRWLSTKEASARLGITLRTLYRLIDEGQVPAYKFGRVIRLKESEIDAFIESARVVPGKLNHLYPESRVEKVGAEEED